MRDEQPMREELMNIINPLLRLQNMFPKPVGSEIMDMFKPIIDLQNMFPKPVGIEGMLRLNEIVRHYQITTGFIKKQEKLLKEWRERTTTNAHLEEHENRLKKEHENKLNEELKKRDIIINNVLERIEKLEAATKLSNVQIINDSVLTPSVSNAKKAAFSTAQNVDINWSKHSVRKRANEWIKQGNDTPIILYLFFKQLHTHKLVKNSTAEIAKYLKNNYPNVTAKHTSIVHKLKHPKPNEGNEVKISKIILELQLIESQ